MVYIIGKGRLVTVNVVRDGKVVETFVVRKSRMHGDNVVYEDKEYPLQAGNIIDVGGKSAAPAPKPPAKADKVLMSRSFRDWDKSVAEKAEAKKKVRK